MWLVMYRITCVLLYRYMYIYLLNYSTSCMYHIIQYIHMCMYKTWQRFKELMAFIFSRDIHFIAIKLHNMCINFDHFLYYMYYFYSTCCCDVNFVFLFVLIPPLLFLFDDKSTLFALRLLLLLAVFEELRWPCLR